MADQEQNTNQAYTVKTTLGFSGAHTLWLVCNGCGAVCTEESETRHNEFHEEIAALSQLLIATNAVLNGHLKDQGLPDTSG